MLNRIAIALVIWGLIVQPLTAAMPDFMSAESSSSFAMMDSDSTIAAHHSISANEASEPPCHETSDVAVDDILQHFLTTGFWLGVNVLSFDPIGNLLEGTLAGQHMLCPFLRPT